MKQDPPNPFEEFLKRILAKPPEPAPRDVTVNTPGRGPAQTGMGLARMLAELTPAEYPLAAMDFFQSAQEGDKLGMGLAMASALPFVPKIPKSLANSKLVAKDYLKTAQEYAEQKSNLTNLLQQNTAPVDPTKKSIGFLHSSGQLFPEFRLDPDILSKGAGDQWQGVGNYITEHPEVGKFYRRATTKIQPGPVVTKSGIPLDLEALRRAAYYKEGPGALTRSRIADKLNPEYHIYFTETAKEQLEDVRERVKNTFKELQALDASELRKLKDPDDLDAWELREATYRYRSALQDFNKLQENLGSRLVEDELLPGIEKAQTYRGVFSANPDEIFDLNRPIWDQPATPRLSAALANLNLPDPRFDNTQTGSLWDNLVYSSRRFSEIPSLSAAGVRNLNDYDLNQMVVAPHGKWGVPYRKDFTDLSPWQMMELLRSKGIVGNKYFTKGTYEDLLAGQTNAPITNNYVVTDPKRTVLTDLWGAAPFLALPAAMKAMQSDSTRK